MLLLLLTVLNLRDTAIWVDAALFGAAMILLVVVFTWRELRAFSQHGLDDA